MVPLLPWERLLWSGGPLRLLAPLRRERYLLTDFRLLRDAGDRVDEIALDDVRDVRRTERGLDRVFGTSTLTVHGRRGETAIVLTRVRRGAPLAALLELLAGDPRAPRDPDAVRAALAWDPRVHAAYLRETVAGALAVLVAIAGVLIGLHGRTSTIIYAADDAIEPGGVKRDRAAIVAFMEREVMPWARQAIGRLKGGPDRVTCETCHGRQPEQRGWAMPAVAALPLPDVRDRGWETWGGSMDAQMRNAIYGYVAESDNQAKAAYMREIVLPGMAGLLHRPAYDFTKSYDYNRSRHAIGCYHCHRVK